MHACSDFEVVEVVKDERKPGVAIPPPPPDFEAGPCRCNVCGKRLLLARDGMCSVCLAGRRGGYGR